MLRRVSAAPLMPAVVVLGAAAMDDEELRMGLEAIAYRGIPGLRTPAAVLAADCKEIAEVRR